MIYKICPRALYTFYPLSLYGLSSSQAYPKGEKDDKIIQKGFDLGMENGSNLDLDNKIKVTTHPFSAGTVWVKFEPSSTKLIGNSLKIIRIGFSTLTHDKKKFNVTAQYLPKGHCLGA